MTLGSVRANREYPLSRGHKTSDFLSMQRFKFVIVKIFRVTNQLLLTVILFFFKYTYNKIKLIGCLITMMLFVDALCLKMFKENLLGM